MLAAGRSATWPSTNDRSRTCCGRVAASSTRHTVDRVTDFLDSGLAAVATERIGATREAAVSDVRTTLTALLFGSTPRQPTL